MLYYLHMPRSAVTVIFFMRINIHSKNPTLKYYLSHWIFKHINHKCVARLNGSQTTTLCCRPPKTATAGVVAVQTDLDLITKHTLQQLTDLFWLILNQRSPTRCAQRLPIECDDVDRDFTDALCDAAAQSSHLCDIIITGDMNACHPRKAGWFVPHSPNSMFIK